MLAGEEVIMPKAFPVGFRRDVVAVARKVESSLAQTAKDFGISESCLHRWLKQADVEDGVRPGVTTAESAEMRELKKRNRCSRRTRSCGGRRRSSLVSRSQNDLPARHRARRRGDPGESDVRGVGLLQAGVLQVAGPAVQRPGLGRRPLGERGVGHPW